MATSIEYARLIPPFREPLQLLMASSLETWYIIRNVVLFALFGYAIYRVLARKDED